jgi:hypothetical protein
MNMQTSQPARKRKPMQQTARITSRSSHSNLADRMARFRCLAILAGPCFMTLLAACGGVPIEEESNSEEAPLETVDSERVAQAGSCSALHLYAVNSCWRQCERYTGMYQCNANYPDYPVYKCNRVTYEVQDAGWPMLSHWIRSESADWLVCSSFDPSGCPAFCN